MNLLTIPLRNLKRKRARTLLLIFVFSVGVLSVVCLNYVSRVVGDSLEKKLTGFGANILVHPRTETLKISYGGFELGNVLYEYKMLEEKKVADKIRGIELKERISIVAPKLVSLMNVGEKPVAVIGVDFNSEIAIKSYWGFNGQPPQAEDEALIGAKAAASLKLVPGSSLKLDGREFRVSGILEETGADDDNVVFISLPKLQEMTGRAGLVTFVEVAALCAGCPIEEITAQLNKALPDVEIRTMQSVVKQRMAGIHFVQHLAVILSSIIVLTACLTVSLSLLSSVNERKTEIGLLRSLGFSKSAIFTSFCFEAGIIGILAGLAGYLLGFIASFKVLELLQAGEGADLRFNAVHLAITLVSVLVLSIAASLPPAWKASRMDPAEALVSL